MSAFPRRFSPCHRSGYRMRRSVSSRHTPHTLSFGLASTRVASAVPTRKSRSFSFCENFAMLPRTTMPNFIPSQMDPSKPATSRPSFLISCGVSAARIFPSVALSPNTRAFSAIMYCSAQLYISPSTAKSPGNHWLRHPLSSAPPLLIFQKNTQFMPTSLSLFNLLIRARRPAASQAPSTPHGGIPRPRRRKGRT